MIGVQFSTLPVIQRSRWRLRASSIVSLRRRSTSASSREELVPADVLGKLPNCEFFAALAGGKLVKGRIPILID